MKQQNIACFYLISICTTKATKTVYLFIFLHKHTVLIFQNHDKRNS